MDNSFYSLLYCYIYLLIFSKSFCETNLIIELSAESSLDYSNLLFSLIFLLLVFNFSYLLFFFNFSFLYFSFSSLESDYFKLSLILDKLLLLLIFCLFLNFSLSILDEVLSYEFFKYIGGFNASFLLYS